MKQHSAESIDETKSKAIIGLVEEVLIKGKEKGKKEKLLARIDTGATKSSIDSKLVYHLKLGPVISVKKINSAHGTSLRPIIETSIILKRRKIKSLFTVADRSHMKYKILIGRNVLRQGFLIDPSKDKMLERKEEDDKK
jgi:hypothetical protein